MKKLGSLVKANDHSEWRKASALVFADSIRSALTSQDQVFVAISGGVTPLSVFQELIEGNYLELTMWEKVIVFWVDERIVPHDHPDSNFGNAQALLKSLPVEFVPMFIPSEGIEGSVKLYNKQLNRLPKKEGVPVFDLVLLGMGNDGHTASLFPGSLGIKDNKSWMIANEVVQLQTTRLTLTFPVIQRSKELLILIFGESKLNILAEIIKGKTEYPIETALEGDNRKTWVYY